MPRQSTKLTSPQIIERATQAERVLADPTLQKAFDGVRQALLASIEDSQLGDATFHHEAALSLQALKSVRRQLQKWIDDGELEKMRNG